MRLAKMFISQSRLCRYQLFRSSTCRSRPFFCSAQIPEIQIRQRQEKQHHYPQGPKRVAFSSNHSSNLSQNSLQNSYEKVIADLPDGAQIHLDFFGEPVTFFGVSKTDKIPTAVASLDGFIIGAASKGKAFTGGGEEEGLSVQSAHSAALAWAELLRHASIWNRGSKSCPMLCYVAVAPMLAQTGVAYVKYIDQLLAQVDSGVEGIPPIQLLEMSKLAASMKDHENLNPRERAHLKALACMLQHDHKRALMIFMRHLQSCPGDGFALSMAIDLAHTVGDSDAALRIAGSVAAYWNERRGGILRPSLPGYNTASSLIAVGLAVGGRRAEAEQMATYSLDKGEKLAGGIATWAMAHVLDAEGRTAEGISACANSDGQRHFEACGFIFFDSILSGYGVRFALDREERGRGRSAALRLYDNNYERVLDYTGFSKGVAWEKPSRKAPVGWTRSSFEGRNKPKAFMTDMFGSKDEAGERQEPISGDGEVVVKEGSLPSLKKENWIPSCEDVLTWLPPTPQLLSDATLLLLRLTLNGTISSKNYRWENLRNAWAALIDIQRSYGGDYRTFEFYPLACIAASLIASPQQVGDLSSAGARLAKGLHKMGELLDLGSIPTSSGDDEEENEEEESFLSTVLFKEIVADKEPDFWLPALEEEKKEEWRTVLKLLSSAIDGVWDPSGEDDTDLMRVELTSGFQCWDFDVRPFLEHAVVYAACKCGDDESLSIARSICSRGVTLRPNSPEEWWRYSIVLGLLGDEVASEDAHAASLAFGGGQGARRDD